MIQQSIERVLQLYASHKISNIPPQVGPLCFKDHMVALGNNVVDNLQSYRGVEVIGIFSSLRF